MFTRSFAILAMLGALAACKNESSPAETKDPAPVATPPPADATAPTPTPTPTPPAPPTDAAGTDAALDGGTAAAPPALDPSKETYKRTVAQIALLEEQIALAAQMAKTAKTSEKRVDAQDRYTGLTQLRDQLKAELKKMPQPK